MSTVQPISVPTKRLASSINAAALTLQLNNIAGWDGEDLTAADLGTNAYAVLRNSDNTAMEIIEYDPATIAAASITILRRGLKFTGHLTTEVTANKLTWIRNETLVELGTDVPQLIQWLKEYIDAAAVAGAVDATLTVKGIVEKATQAEIDAGTALGGTGAQLAVVPDQLALSIYATRLPSATQKLALAGNGGTPGSANLYVTEVGLAGFITMYGGPTAPTGWLACDGSAVSRTTYATLFAILFPSIGTVTVTIAAPGLMTKTAHGLATGDALYLTTTGALPTGLTASTRYWIVKNDADSFWLSTTLANALAGTKITTTGSQSGTHTAVRASYGIGDGSTTFNLPSFKGAVPAGKDQTQTEFAGHGQTGGEKTHTLTIAEMPAHAHPVYTGDNTGNPQKNFALQEGDSPGTTGTTTAGTNNPIQAAGGDTAHNVLQPYLTVTFIIKT